MPRARHIEKTDGPTGVGTVHASTVKAIAGVALGAARKDAPAFADRIRKAVEAAQEA